MGALLASRNTSGWAWMLSAEGKGGKRVFMKEETEREGMTGWTMKDLEGAGVGLSM